MVKQPEKRNVDLTGRKILVVGAAQGIGRATAIWLAGLGARVIPADIQDCDDTALACGGVSSVKLDLSDRENIEAVINDLADNDGPLYGVVNCAGILLRRPLDDTTPDELELQTAINQSGAFYLARAAMKKMQTQGEGRIVLYTSQGAFTGGFNGSIPYAMNKAAVTALVKSLARIGAPQGITVNAVAPGAVDTAMLRDGMTQQDLDNFQAMIPMRRFADPEELAGPTAFLLSEWAGYITGTTLHVNGGQLML
ncbi:MAG: SDR family oxidoreductase [Rhizobiales bacterium]|nr:SDR family oxidoreductase [Hyphomicrobiales bacterium]NRB15446.1 SDR family oxidoreductase [Hyphomicrobiales bacterium]